MLWALITFLQARKSFSIKQLKIVNLNFLILISTNKDDLEDAFENIDVVVHLSANADVRFGLNHPYKDLEQNTIATFNLLETMRLKGCSKIIFSSTGSVYGEAKVIPTPEDAPFPVQTSLYGASKCACEGLISHIVKVMEWMQLF